MVKVLDIVIGSIAGGILFAVVDRRLKIVDRVDEGLDKFWKGGAKQ